MKRITLHGSKGMLVTQAITKKKLFRFDENGEHVIYEGAFPKSDEQRLMKRFNGTVEEVQVLTQVEYDKLKEFEDKYNKAKMEIVRLKGKLKG